MNISRILTALSAFLVVPITSIIGSTCVQAGTLTPNGTIIGIFDPNSIITNGNVLNDPALGQITYLDNSGTAVSTINNSTDPTLAGSAPPLQSTGSSLIWGTNSPPGSDTFSELDFFGAQIPANVNQPFLVGRITYLNGTSALNSLIFGATISFYDNFVTPSDYLGSDSIIISTTNNLNVNIVQDADYINICGNNSNICNSSLEAFEDSEGGTGVTADLYATIVGDPTLDLQSITLTPGQDPATSGVVGDLPPLGAAVPEPSSIFGTIAALGLGAFWKRRQARLKD